MPAAEPRYGADHRYAAGPAPSPPNYGGAPAASPHYSGAPAAAPSPARAAAPAAVVAQPYPAYGNAYPAGGRGAAGMVRDPRNGDAYEIQPNDTYWSISEKLYGSGAYFKALAEHNRKKVPHEDDLQVGDVIAAPDIAQLEKLYPDLCPKPSRREPPRPRTTAVSVPRHTGGRMYVAQEGDTLYDIARRELGKASRWVDIYELNREALGSDYNYLPPGVQLVLPEGEAAGVITRRPGAAGPYYQR
jgi:nucleoid-associated protein YgaU